MVLLFVFRRVWTKDALLLLAHPFIYPLLPSLYDYFFSVKERWMLSLIGIIYSGIIYSVTEVIAYRFNLVQTAWTQGLSP